MSFVGCSRLHARIAFDSTGTPWLRDLGSANGTTVNKKQLPKISIGPHEALPSNHNNGSRGVILYPGDIIQFGASTRIFLLNGPLQYQRGAKKEKMQLHQINRNNIQQKKTHNDDEISLETNHDQDSSSPSSEPKVLFDYSSIPEKFHKLRDKIQAKKYKLNNIKEEMRRIEVKSHTIELSSGQLQQLERITKQKDTLQQEIDALQQDLDAKINTNNNNKENSTALKSTNEYIYDEDDVDDFYDRTTSSSNKRQKQCTQAETIESLKIKWKSFLQTLQMQQSRSQQSQIQVQTIQQDIQDKKNNGSTNEDCFFLQNDLEIVNQQYHKHNNDIANTEKELAEFERLMLIINDKLVFDRKLFFIGTQANLDLLRNETKPQNIKIPSTNEALMPPPPRLLPRQIVSSKQNNPDVTQMPPPSRPVNNIMSPPCSSSQYKHHQSTQTHSSSPHTKKTRHGPCHATPVGTLQSIQQVSLSSSISNQETIKLKNSRKINQEIKRNSGIIYNQNKTNSNDPKVDQWIAPKEQDGSGKTKLNDKFGGRY